MFLWRDNEIEYCGFSYALYERMTTTAKLDDAAV